MDKFLTAEEVAQQLDLSVSTVKRWLTNGELPGYKVGGSWRIDPSDYQQWLAERKNIKKQSKLDQES